MSSRKHKLHVLNLLHATVGERKNPGMFLYRSANTTHKPNQWAVRNY